MIKTVINHLSKKHKLLFLIDSLGALLTAFFLFVIIKPFNAYFGMSETILTFLYLIAICFCIYSAACFLFLKRCSATFIRIIGMANLLYCILIMIVLIMYNSKLTTIGLMYFLIEIVIICTLAYIELNVATAIKKINHN